MLDEDFVIIIVGNDDEEENQTIKTEIKQEPCDEDLFYDQHKVEEIIKNAKTFGEEIDVKQEIIVEYKPIKHESDYDPSSNDEEVSGDDSSDDDEFEPPLKSKVKSEKSNNIKRKKPQYDDKVDASDCKKRQKVNLNYVEDKIDSEKYILNCGISSDDEEYYTRSKKRIEDRMKVNKNNAISKVIIKDKNYVKRLREKDLKYKDTNELINKLVEIMTRIVNPEYEDKNYTLKFNDSLYCCNSCDYSTDKFDYIKIHFGIKHRPYYLVCYACGMEYNNMKALVRHEIRCRSPDAKIVLKAREIFRKKFPQGVNYNREKKKRKQSTTSVFSGDDKKQRIYNCKYCHAQYSYHTIKAHENRHLGVKPYECTHCQEAFYGYHAMRRHERKYHSEIYYECDHCSKQYKDKDAFRLHIKSHYRTYLFHCDRVGCTGKFTTQERLDLHLGSVHHDENIPPKHICKYCKKAFYRFKVLAEHMKVKHGMRVVKKTTWLNERNKRGELVQLVRESELKKANSTL